MKKITLFNLLLFVATTAFAQTGEAGIGTTNPDASSILDIESTNKGVLLPRVTLTSNTMDLDSDAGTTQPNGLLIYNAAGGALPEGYYYWDGSLWNLVAGENVTPPVISTLDCDAADLNPPQYESGVAYTGTLKIPYTGGNGGKYASAAGIVSNGLTATRNPGTLEYGNGFITYSVTGVPTVTSPTTTDFVIPAEFGVPGCTATVGTGASKSGVEVKKIQILGTVTTTGETIVSGDFEFKLLNRSGNLAYDVRPVNPLPSTTILRFSRLSGVGVSPSGSKGSLTWPAGDTSYKNISFVSISGNGHMTYVSVEGGGLPPTFYVLNVQRIGNMNGAGLKSLIINKY